jgi:hypothetical protein
MARCLIVDRLYQRPCKARSSEAVLPPGVKLPEHGSLVTYSVEQPPIIIVGQFTD